jgi:serpin B
VDNGKVVVAEVQRETPQFMDQSLLDQQVAANNDFAFDLYRSLHLEDGNLFYSPYSISLALAMTYAGARGETEKQMSATLHYVLPKDRLHPVFNMLDQSLKTSESDDPSFQLDVTNSLWGQDQFPFLPDFLTLIARNYGAGVRLVDFTSDANREAARQTINDWVSQQTNKKIKELLPQGMLNDFTRLILVNAIYFKGEWQDPFESGTSDAPFILPDGQQVKVPTMSRRAHAPYFQGDGYQAVGLPYKGGRAEMIIVMPDPGKFSEFEQTLDQKSFDRILAGLGNNDVKLYMPKFHFEYSKDMKDSLAGMGMPAAFDPGQADFSGIYDQKIEPNNLFISHIAHKAFVAVDEKGTEAAAATGAVMEMASMPVMLRIDHPFIFVIRDRQTGSILFVGRVLDPRTP